MEDFLNQQSHEHHHSKSFENNEIPENADEEIGEYHEGSLAVKSRVQGFDNLLTNFKD